MTAVMSWLRKYASIPRTSYQKTITNGKLIPHLFLAFTLIVFEHFLDSRQFG